ncbi:MAG TPA: IS21 family transposase [Lysobacter sp.]|nr:IS21 family transposase [Lysobacter sp.]
MFNYRQVLVRMRQGDSDRDIARSKLMGRRKLKTLRVLAHARGWLEAASALPEDGDLAAALKPAPAKTCVSSLEPLRESITAWFANGIQGTTIHAALQRNHGYRGSYSAVRRFLRGLADQATPATTMRLHFAPGEDAQVDFGMGPTLVDQTTGLPIKTWFFVMTLCWSRHQYAEIVRDQKVSTWLACHRRAFEWFGGVPSGRIIIDNPKCAITRACTTDPTVQRAYAECAEGYGFKISPCPPADPQKKGIVEAGVKYIKRAFLPLRDFRDLTDANRQLHDWVLASAGTRCHGTTRLQPLAQFAIEKPLLKPLPAVAPPLAVWAQVTVHRDAHVQFEHVLYSVPFRLMGQRLWLKATTAIVQCFREHELVATHPRHPLSKRSTLRDHLPPEALAWSMADPQWCLTQAEQIGPACRGVIERLFADRVLDNLRAAQGVIRLAKKHGATRLEAACARALAFDAARYRTVKTILDKGLDQQIESTAFDRLAETYTRGGRFCRDPLSSKPH